MWSGKLKDEVNVGILGGRTESGCLSGLKIWNKEQVMETDYYTDNMETDYYTDNMETDYYTDNMVSIGY